MTEGQVAAITGASSGIGKAAALELARLGAKLVLGARYEDALMQVAEQIRQAGGEVVYRSTDVSKRQDLMALVSLAKENFRRLDVLFSNAGAMPIGPFDELAVEDWETMVDVNIKGVLYGIAAALPVFREQGSGYFVHTASTAARKTIPNQVVYSATNAAVLALSDGLRQELAGQIRVSTLAPPALDQRGHELLEQAHYRSDVSVVKIDPFRRRRVQPRLHRKLARVVYQDVDATKGSKSDLAAASSEARSPMASPAVPPAASM